MIFDRSLKCEIAKVWNDVRKNYGRVGSMCAHALVTQHISAVHNSNWIQMKVNEALGKNIEAKRRANTSSSTNNNNKKWIIRDAVHMTKWAPATEFYSLRMNEQELSQQTVCWLMHCEQIESEMPDSRHTICNIIYSLWLTDICALLLLLLLQLLLISLLMQSFARAFLSLLSFVRTYIFRVTLRTTVTWCGLHQYSNDCAPFWCANIMNLKWKITGFISPKHQHIERLLCFFIIIIILFVARFIRFVSLPEWTCYWS